MAMIGVLPGSELEQMDVFAEDTKYDESLAGVVRASGRKHLLSSSEFLKFAQRFSEM